ncbi:MAG TPA: GNAT family N-acetyltransferase [Anaerolineales bacterium]|nr:GNAT family N-acetyltransferase [Anaerolineales bacterium]
MAENPSNILIRQATAADNELLAAIGAETFRDTFAADNTPEDMALYLAGSFSPERQATELADPASRFLIASLAGDVVGYVRLKFAPPPVSVGAEQAVEIARLYARKAWIGHGVGAALMRASLAAAAQAGLTTIWLDVWEKNPRAIAFYEKWGFRIVGEQVFQLGSDAQRDLLMARPLEASGTE